VNCERCGERPGTIRYTEYVEGESRRMRICPECAEALGFGGEEAAASGAESETAPEESAIPEFVFPESSKGDAAEKKLRCPRCRLTGKELRRVSLFGCEACYETFAASLGPLFQRVHGARTHRGRLPGGEWATPDEPDASS
jgi:protein arginine kinase activator